ncbi:MAG: inositol monophosphatase family protein [Desulfovibrionaceae bacterium]
MSDQDWSAVLEETVAAVREAEAIVRDHWSKPRQVRHKGRVDLVTQTDLAVEGMLKERLARILPEATFLAEESAGAAPCGPLTWIIDPVDGTTNFAHGVPMVAISVGLWQGDTVRLGVLSVPMLDELYWAVRGQGAWCNGERLGVTYTSDLVDSLIATGFPYAIGEHLDSILAMLGRVLPLTRGVRRCGAAAVDLAWTARGRFDGFYETDLNPWDVAAGWLLVEEAGGRVTQYSGAPYAVGSKTILATNGRIHDALRRALADVDA